MNWEIICCGRRPLKTTGSTKAGVGPHTVFNYEKLKSPWMTDLPGTIRRVLSLTPIAATYLAVNAMMGCALFAQYAGFPGILWAVVPALLAGFVAYGRKIRKPV